MAPELAPLKLSRLVGNVARTARNARAALVAPSSADTQTQLARRSDAATEGPPGEPSCARSSKARGSRISPVLILAEGQAATLASGPLLPRPAHGAA